MKVSVVIPTYSMERYEDFRECVESVLSQTYDDVEAVIIVDGNEEVCEKARKEFGDHSDTVIYCNHDDAGPLSRANMGSVQATGDVVAMTDDDAVPRDDWVETLVDTYEDYDCISVGGRIEPEWVAGKAEYIPEEYYWLIGATHRGFREDEGEVRNTFGANLSFRRDVFMRLGGIKLGGIGPSSVQGRETEFCARMQKQYGEGVMYNPRAVVYHKIYDYRTKKRWLVKRAFWQGFSKRGMEKWVPESSDDESRFLRNLIFDYIPERTKSAVTDRSKPELMQLVMLLTLTAAVGFGYLWGIVKWR